MDPKTILCVDDSNTQLMMEKMILKRDKYRIVTANNGAEGVEKALSEKPDLILMDVVMPKMNGIEAVEKLRELRETSGIPIIMVTTRAEAENVESAYLKGCNDYVTKPLDSLELTSKIRNLLGSTN